MGILTTTIVSCDYSECKGGQNGPRVVSWCNEEVKTGVPLPEGATEFVSFNMNGTPFAFCGKLHSAKFFLPPGFEIVAKKVVDFPDNGNFPEVKTEEA